MKKESKILKHLQLVLKNTFAVLLYVIIRLRKFIENKIFIAV